jgi:hypothetical protein
MTRDTISKDIIDITLKDFRKRFDDKMGNLKNTAFVSLYEICGKGLEEFQEIQVEAHARNKDAMASELLDLATVCLRGYASIRVLQQQK